MRNLKKILALLMTGIMLVLAAGCGGGSSSNSSSGSGAKAPSNGKRVGVAMPTQSSQRWIQDGANMKQKLEALGYEVDLQYAEDDVQAQVSQIENMITNGANCLVVASIDSSALVNALAQAKANNIPVIAYDRLLMDTDSVSYYATFDNKGVGTLIGKYVEKKLGLAEGKGPYNVEFFAGSPDDNNAHFLNDGLFEVLKPYIDKGQLVVPSGQTDFNTICTLRWSQEAAQKRMEDIICGYYSNGKKLDAVISPFDGISYGIAAALEGAGYQVGTNWPIITGQDAELMATKNIISGKQTMTVFKDTRILADKCVMMVQAVLEGKDPEINDTKSYDNHKLIVPSYLCTPVAVDKDNYQKELVDSNYYKAADLGL